MDVADWHQGRMTCRKLLALVLNLPEDSAFYNAVRDGEWTLHTQLMATTVNEIRLSRADRAAIHGQSQGCPELVMSPRERERQEAAKQPARDAHAHVSSRLRGEIAYREVVDDE